MVVSVETVKVLLETRGLKGSGNREHPHVLVKFRINFDYRQNIAPVEIKHDNGGCFVCTVDPQSRGYQFGNS